MTSGLQGARPVPLPPGVGTTPEQQTARHGNERPARAAEVTAPPGENNGLAAAFQCSLLGAALPMFV